MNKTTAKITRFAILILFPILARQVQSAPRASAFSNEPAQGQTFDYLKEKSGIMPAMPQYPQHSVIAWVAERHRQEHKDNKSKYAIAGEDLLIVRKLLSDKSPQRQRQGMRLAQYTGVFIFNKLRDKWLYARVYEGFLLPHLSVAYAERWQDLSRQRIAESAASAFEQADEKENQIKALRLLLELQTEQNTQDWTRGELSQVLASQGRYEEAIAQLKAIQSAGMSNVKKLMPQYEKLLQEQEQRKKSSDKPKEK